MRYANRGWMLGRVFLGLFFIYAPLVVVFKFGGMNPPEMAPAASGFALALDQTRFMNPLIIVSMLIGGVALLSNRTAPAGLILLAPSIVVIACFHWFLTGKYLWGSIWPLWFALLIWRYRDVFSRLWMPIGGDRDRKA